MRSGAVEALKAQTGIAKRPVTIQEKLDSLKPQIQLALPRHLNPDRMVRIALTCMRVNPKLMECTAESVMASIMISAQLGLEPGVMGQAYLVPYRNKQGIYICQLIPGWMGLVDLVNRAGKASVWPGAVYKGDEFEWALGDKPFLTHKPCGDEAVLTHVYAIGRLTNSQWPIIEVWTAEKIWKHRNKVNKVGELHYSFAWPEAYAKKIPLLQVLKYMPKSIELSTALSLENSAESGGQSFGIKDVPSVIEGTIIPVAEEVPEFSDDRAGVEQAKKPESVMCGACGVVDGHDSGCKHAKTDSTATAEPIQTTLPPQAGKGSTKSQKASQTHNFAKLFASAREKGIQEEEIKSFYKKKYKVESGTDLTPEQFAAVEKEVSTWNGPAITE